MQVCWCDRSPASSCNFEGREGKGCNIHVQKTESTSVDQLWEAQPLIKLVERRWKAPQVLHPNTASLPETGWIVLQPAKMRYPNRKILRQPFLEYISSGAPVRNHGSLHTKGYCFQSCTVSVGKNSDVMRPTYLP